MFDADGAQMFNDSAEMDLKLVTRACPFFPCFIYMSPSHHSSETGESKR